MPYNLRSIIETEYGAPAIGDAKERLGYEFRDYTLPMKSIMAVGIPEELGDMGHADRRRALACGDAHFLLQVVTGKSPDDEDLTIMPKVPILASVSDLVQFAWLVAIPEAYSSQVVNQVVTDLQAAKLDLTRRLSGLYDDTQSGLMARYGNQDIENGMASVAGTVVGTLASMVQLHANLKAWGNLPDVLEISDPSLWQSVGNRDAIPHRIAAEWRKIETVNYHPLSTISAQILEDPDMGARLGPTLTLIHYTITKYVSTGIGVTTNVAAEIWQSMIPDRDQRASYYTKPTTAEILANLTTARLMNPAEARYSEVCAGTGTLARATEENIRFRHYAKASAKTSIHAGRMERCIQLTDLNQQSISVATGKYGRLGARYSFRCQCHLRHHRRGRGVEFPVSQRSIRHA